MRALLTIPPAAPPPPRARGIPPFLLLAPPGQGLAEGDDAGAQGKAPEEIEAAGGLPDLLQVAPTPKPRALNPKP